MPFEQLSKPAERQSQLEKLQRLSRKEQLVLFELAHRIGVTQKQEITTNFLSQLHPDHLMGLYEKWHELERGANDQGTSIESLSHDEIEVLLTEVIGERQ